MFDARCGSNDTKERILDAAADIVAAQGATHLTFDALVKRTGISKGGILYHYASKKDLLAGMVAPMMKGFDARCKDIARSEKNGLVDVKAYIRASFEEDEGERPSSSAILAAAANDPELLAIVRDHYNKTFEQMRGHGADAMRAMMLIAAVDGIWLLDAFRLCSLSSGERMNLKKFLLQMADELNP